MARGLRPLAASVTWRVETGVISGAEGLLRPHPKLTLGGPQAFAQLNGSHPGGVVPSHSTLRRLERIQDPNLVHVGRALDGPSTASK